MPGLRPGVRRIKDPRGEEARAPCDALLAPGARAARGLWPSVADLTLDSRQQAVRVHFAHG